jgi:hypothetical protein
MDRVGNTQQDDQQSNQEQRQHPNAGRLWGKPFAKGVNGFASWRERVAAKAREIAEPLGGLDRMSALDRLYVEKAASLLLRNPHNGENELRLCNAARELISRVEARAERRGAAHPFMKAR